jgi:predicted nucleic acid-binding protein
VVVPRAVERELTEVDRLFPGRLYPDTALFQELRVLMRDPPAEEPPPLSVFGGGEAAAIPLAQALQAAILMNDRRPAIFARNLGLTVLTVPDIVVVLRARELIAAHMARAMLAASQRHGTSPALIAIASQVLDSLGS